MALSSVSRSRRIPLVMLLRVDQLKGFFIPQYSKYNVAELVHDSSKGGHFRLVFAFFLIKAVDHRIFRFPIFTQTDRLQSEDIKTAPRIREISFGNFHIRPCGVAGLTDRRIKAKVGIELLRAAECAEIPNFAYQGHCVQETRTWNCLQQLYLL